ncbi:MAG TPA: glutamine amidotransferase [Armatimonadota bacterium]|jgi:uncharacterized membrane protein
MTRRLLTLAAALGLALLGTIHSGFAQVPPPAVAPPPVRVSEVPLAKQSEDAKQTSYLQQMFLDNGVRLFGLQKYETVSKQTQASGSSVGWFAPSEGNWYHSDMFDLLVNGQSVKVDKSTFTILESGERGVVDFTLDNKFGKFRCRFMVIPGSEVLFADFAIEPTVEVKSLVLRLQNYPSSYHATAEGKRHRQVLDADGTCEPQAAPYVTDPNADWWYFYQDAIFDKDIPERREATYGPSALVLPAGEAQQVSTTVGDYQVPIEITYAPTQRHFRLAFLDYFGLGNKEAQARFVQERDQIRQTLQGLVFVPTRLRQAQANLPQIKPDGLTGEAAAAAPELKQLLAALPGGDPWPQKPVSAEARALQLLDVYDKARWVATKRARPGIGVLVLRGLHARYWGVDEAEQLLGAQLREAATSYYSEYYWKGEDLNYFPATWPELSRFDVVVFANVPFTVLGPDRAKALAEYVQAGGALLLLGGTHGFGQAGIDQPPLGPLMPVQPTKVFDLQTFASPQPLTKGPAAPEWLTGAGVDWSKPPVALWYHQVQTAPSGRVWLQAGGKPFLVAGAAGAGRVAAICAPPYGVAPTGRTGFWEWKSWPGVMAKLLVWLGRGEVPTKPTAGAH